MPTSKQDELIKMDDAAATLKQMNRTLIGSVLFIDIVNYSVATVPDQLAMKEAFIDLLVEAIQNVAPADRIMVDTGDGAGIAFIGDPEDALFTALTLRDAIESGQVKVGEPGFVRMGINLGPLKVVRDINGHTNMIGDAVNDAQRVMSFAEAGQVMVSHSYYDIISRFSRDYSKLFVHEGMRHDKHVREHEVYRFGPVAETEDLAAKLRDRGRARSGNTGTFAWQEDDAPAAAGPAAKTIPAKPSPAPSAPKHRLPHMAIGLIAGFACLVVVVGVVWSWSSGGASTATARPDATADAPTAAASTPAAQQTPAPVPASTAASTTAPAAMTPAQASASVPAATPDTSAPATPDNIVATAPPASAPESNADASTGTNTAATKAAKAAAATSATPATDDTKHPDSASPAAASTPATPAAKPGTLKLAIQPWGEVYVDGSKRGVSPPINSLNLAPGKHRIEIRNGQFAPQKLVVEIKSGAETTVSTSF